nr:right-handed parallel beta-helix repeat-containing protein [Candidatus Sigynarchaeota archaeon]
MDRENHIIRNIPGKLITIVAFMVVFCLTTSTMQHSGQNHGGQSGFLNGIHASDPKLTINGNTELAMVATRGNGSLQAPYVIENRVIDAGNSGSAISMGNTNAFALIQNCTLTRAGSGSDAGLRLDYCTNVNVTGNRVLNNAYYGISLDHCTNITIQNNNASNNWMGMKLNASPNNTISNNTVLNNLEGIAIISSNDVICETNTIFSTYYDGIAISDSLRAVLSNNPMISCGIALSGSTRIATTSHSIAPTNTVNGKPIYYYSNTTGLKGSDFVGAGQVLIANCNDSVITGLDVDGGSGGALVAWSKNVTITFNTITNILHESCIHVL